MLNQSLQQKLSQKLSPQQIQLIKLLELPTIQLEQRIKKELEENPILEEGKEQTQEELAYNEQNKDDADNEKDNKNEDEFSFDDYIEDDNVPSYKLHTSNYSKDDKRVDIPYSEGISLHEHLINQLGLQNFTEEELVLAKYIIGNIDEAGYLRRDVMGITDDLALRMAIYTKDEEVEKVLRKVQKLDPAGIAARDLQDCLILQIENKPELAEKVPEDILKTAVLILRDFFDEFSKKHYSKITQKLDITRDELKDAIDVILRLNPKPGSAFSGMLNKTAQHITPDFILEIQDGRHIISLNSGNIPDLRLSKTYSDMLKSFKNSSGKSNKKNKDTVNFVKQKLASAKWFIDAIKQRHNTLLLTINAIALFQEEYFKDGDEMKLRPMILKDIAERTNLDISTISRVANSKYIQTHFGIFPLKFFFTEGMETADGTNVSTREIKKILQECISKENKQKPLTDERLAKILQEKGYKIARRTVAKYREQLGILVARLRKEL